MQIVGVIDVRSQAFRDAITKRLNAAEISVAYTLGCNRSQMLEIAKLLDQQTPRIIFIELQENTAYRVLCDLLSILNPLDILIDVGTLPMLEVQRLAHMMVIEKSIILIDAQLVDCGNGFTITAGGNFAVPEHINEQLFPALLSSRAGPVLAAPSGASRDVRPQTQTVSV